MSSIIFEIYVILLFASIFFPENILISFNFAFFAFPCITTNKSQLINCIKQITIKRSLEPSFAIFLRKVSQLYKI